MAFRQIYDVSLRVCFFDLWVKIGAILDVQLLGLIEVGVEGCPAHQVVGVLNFELGVHPVRALLNKHAAFEVLVLVGL